MITDFYLYYDFIKNIMRKLTVLKTEQLILSLMNYYYDDVHMSREKAQNILNSMQAHGYILLSKSGYAMTKGYYKTITADKFMDNLNYDSNKARPELSGYYHLPDNLTAYDTAGNYSDSGDIEYFINDYYKKLINCYWIVVDMFPESYSFAVTQEPYNIMFGVNNEDDSALYELVYIDKQSARWMPEILRNTAKGGSPIDHDGYEDVSAYIHRIVILEDKNDAWRIPYIGVDFICVLDETSDTHYEVIETREGEDRWKDVV